MAMSSESRYTVDHDLIRKWVEQRGGHPATIKGTGKGGEAGVLRIDFPGGAGEEKLEHISWDEFFNKFEENQLAMLYQERTAGGKESRFVKFVNRGTVQAEGDVRPETYS